MNCEFTWGTISIAAGIVAAATMVGVALGYWIAREVYRPPGGPHE